MIRLIIIIFFIILKGNNIYSQSNNLLFDHYTDQDGFISGQALNIHKDSRGFVWIGTENGLARFDGHHFKYFKHDEKDSTSIPSNYVNLTSLDKHDRLWIATTNLQGFLDTRTNKFNYINFESDLPNKVSRLKYDFEKDVTFVITMNGIFSFSGAKAVIKKMYFEGIEHLLFEDLCIIDDRYYLMGRYGLFIFDQNGKKINEFRRPGASLLIEDDDDFMSSYYDIKSNTLHIGCWTHGLFTFDVSTQKMKHHLYNNNKQIQNGIINIHKFEKLGFENKLFLATVHGVYIYDIFSHRFDELSDFAMADKLKIEGQCIAFCESKNEGLWIGTLGGLFKLDINKQIFEIEPIPIIKDWSLASFIVDQYTSKDSIIWLKYDYATIFKYDIINNKLLPLPKKLIPHNTVENGLNHIYIDDKHRLWVTSEKKGVLVYHLDRDTLSFPPLPKVKNKSINLLNVIQDKSNKIYFSCVDGLYYYDELHNIVQEETKLMDYLRKNNLSSYIRDFCFDNQNRLWAIGLDLKTREPYVIVAEKNFKSISYYHHKLHEDLISFSSFDGIINAANGRTMLYSTNGFGILKFENNFLEVKKIMQYANKPVLSCRGAVTDGKNSILIASDNALMKYTNNILTFLNKRNSAWDGNTYPYLYFSDRSKTLYASQKKHFLVSKIDTLLKLDQDTVMLTDINVSNFPQLHPDDFSNIYLYPNQNTIKFTFSNMNFTNSENSYYEYRMNDDTSWTGLKGSELLFNKIGYGNYNLEVRSYNSFGNLSSKNYKVKFTIKPPYNKTWWFQGGVIGLISFLIFSFFKYRENQIKKLAKIRHNIARDLHDDLGSNLSNIKILSEIEAAKNSDANNETYNHIAEKSRAMMSSISDIVWSINPSNDTLEELVQKIQVFAIDTLEKINIDLHFNVPAKIPNLHLPLDYRRHIYLIAKEAINNVAKYSTAKNMNFTVEINGKNLSMTFKDDGLGFDENKIKFGNGLKNMRGRASEMKGNLDIVSNIKGTSIYLTLNIP